MSSMASRRGINPWTWGDEFGFVQAVEIQNGARILQCAGQGSIDKAGRVLHTGDMRAQVSQAMDNVETVLGAAGLSLSDVTRLNYYTTDVDAFNAVVPAYLEPRLRRAGCRPAGVLLGVTRLAQPEMLIEIEATAVSYATTTRRFRA
jgi:enamine deaminase RidA (YjgF/YER057c/UK114 family)